MLQQAETKRPDAVKQIQGLNQAHRHCFQQANLAFAVSDKQISKYRNCVLAAQSVNLNAATQTQKFVHR